MELKFKNEFAFHVLGRKCMLKKISLNASMIMNGTPYIHHHIMNTFQRKFKYSCWVCVKKLSFISCRAPKKCKSVKYTAGDLGEKQRASEEIGNWERKLDWLPPLGIFSISCRATKQGDSPTTVYIQRGERKKGPNKSVTTTGETGGGKGKSWKGSMKVRKTTKYVRVYEVRNLNCACFCLLHIALYVYYGNALINWVELIDKERDDECWLCDVNVMHKTRTTTLRLAVKYGVRKKQDTYGYRRIESTELICISSIAYILFPRKIEWSQTEH